jgi:hypothetical protein
MQRSVPIHSHSNTTPQQRSPKLKTIFSFRYILNKFSSIYKIGEKEKHCLARWLVICAHDNKFSLISLKF